MEAEDSNTADLRSEVGCMPVEEERNVVDMRIWGPEIPVAYMGLYVEASTYVDTEEVVSRRMQERVDQRMVEAEQIVVEEAPGVAQTLGSKVLGHSDTRQTDFQGQQVDEVFVSALRP
jgi:hypothetical protein